MGQTLFVKLAITLLASTLRCWFKYPRTTRYSGIVSPTPTIFLEKFPHRLIATDQFAEQWSHPTKCPTVHAVYRIIGTQQSWDTYHSYRYVTSPMAAKACKTELTNRGYSNQLEYYGQFAARGKRVGNECLLWHGTRRVCNLGDSGNTTPCANPSCALCSVICGSFDVTKVLSNKSLARFGAGIHTSTRSSK